jgi:hypothetical protein
MILLGLAFIVGSFTTPASAICAVELSRHHRRTQLAVGRQQAVKTDQMQPRSVQQRSQQWQELQRQHHQLRGEIAPGDYYLASTAASFFCSIFTSATLNIFSGAIPGRMRLVAQTMPVPNGRFSLSL